MIEPTLNSCIRCKKTDETISYFIYQKENRSLLSSGRTTLSYKVPTCWKCKEKFRKFSIFENLFYKLQTVLICISLILLYFPMMSLFFGFGYAIMDPTFIFRIISSFLPTITILIFMLISNYLKAKMTKPTLIAG